MRLSPLWTLIRTSDSVKIGYDVWVVLILPLVDAGAI